MGASSNIYNARTNRFNLPGIEEVSGNFQFEADADHMGLPLKLWNGQVTSAAFAAYGAAPGITISSGGTLTAGSYYYRTAMVLQRTSDGKRFWGTGSASSLVATTASSNLTVDLTWSNPTVPTGFTHYGTALFRTAAAGGNTTQVYLTTVVGTGTSYSNSSTTPALDTAVTYPGAIYTHTYTVAAPVAGTHPLGSFSITKMDDQADVTSRTYYGCRMEGFGFSIGDPSSPAKCTFDVMGRNTSTVADPSPSYSIVRPMMSWQGFATIDGTAATYFEGCDFTAKNNLEAIPSLAGVQYHRDFYPKLRDISGTVKFAYESKANFTKMINATEFALAMVCDGTPTTAGSIKTISSVVYEAMPYCIEVTLPKCLFTTGGGNINAADRMIESLPFKCAHDTTTTSELKIVLWNATSAYA